MIIGLLPPRGTKWHLTVDEDPAGVPDRYPRFRPEGESNVNEYPPSTHIATLTVLHSYSPQ